MSDTRQPKPPREAIPNKTRDAVLDEYNHRCAICGKDRPQLHHIDEDRINNAPQNLLPLCANHHLTDQHNPTRMIEIGKLRLFRRHKDPCILLPQFDPIYRRQRFLEEVLPDRDPATSLDEAVTELVDFVRHMEKGVFYAERLEKLLADSGVSIFSLDEPEHVFAARMRKRGAEHREKVIGNRDAAQALLVEMLVYQNWQVRPT